MHSNDSLDLLLRPQWGWLIAPVASQVSLCYEAGGRLLNQRQLSRSTRGTEIAN